MEFKIWLEGIEKYDPFKRIVAQKAQDRQFVFNDWFPEERIYIPMISSNQNQELLNDLNKAIEDAGFTVTDLKNGYAQKQNNKNLFSIGRILNDLEKKDLKKTESDYQIGSISTAKYNDEIRMTNKYWSDLKNSFNTRGTASNLEVVISKNIHDIGSMSTGRGWQSCMTLGIGSHHEDIYCEVKYGGFVAYLIRENDKDIERPIARIHIRRFDNKKGKFIAIPEESIYGEDVPEFLEVVKNWIKSKQGTIQPGPYKRVGGKYSDTWGDTKQAFIPPDLKDVETIIKWLNKWMSKSKKEQAKYYPYFLNTIQSYFQSKETFPKEFNVNLKDYLFGNTTFPTGKNNFNQNTEQFLPAFAIKNPDLINQDEFVRIFKYAAQRQDNLIDKLIKAFPQYLTQELLDSLQSERLKSQFLDAKPEFEAYYKEKVERDARENFKTDNPAFQVTERDSIYVVSGKISDQLRKLEILRPIPEPLIRQLVDFAKNVHELQLEPKNNKDYEKPDKIRNDIVSYLVHTFHMTKSDTPTVQRFYQHLLPKWNQLGGIGVLGSAIAHLGENGKQFLPFIKNKKEELQKEFEANQNDKLNKLQYEQALESYDYVIDALQNGTGYSNKYKMSYGKGIEYRLANQ
jgi:hypothetical protein